MATHDSLNSLNARFTQDRFSFNGKLQFSPDIILKDFTHTASETSYTKLFVVTLVELSVIEILVWGALCSNENLKI